MLILGRRLAIEGRSVLSLPIPRWELLPDLSERVASRLHWGQHSVAERRPSDLV